jgi:hypothetical protein
MRPPPNGWSCYCPGPVCGSSGSFRWDKQARRGSGTISRKASAYIAGRRREIAFRRRGRAAGGAPRRLARHRRALPPPRRLDRPGNTDRMVRCLLWLVRYSEPRPPPARVVVSKTARLGRRGCQSSLRSQWASSSPSMLVATHVSAQRCGKRSNSSQIRRYCDEAERCRHSLRITFESTRHRQ